MGPHSARDRNSLCARGRPESNRDTAREFWLSDQTIKYHLTNMIRKLQVRSRTEAVRLAYEHQLIENPVLRPAALTA